MSYQTAKIRHFLIKHFNGDELHGFMFDYFPAVHQRLSLNMTKNQEIQLLLEHCRRQEKMEVLLTALQQERPKAYSQVEFVDQLKPPSRPAPEPKGQQNKPKQAPRPQKVIKPEPQVEIVASKPAHTEQQTQDLGDSFIHPIYFNLPMRLPLTASTTCH